ncbi:MAG: hydantoinase/oxoprolinase family protein [Alphaproteobacteria bacterium]|nr:hydantoinase/oxoprolinase family protein [Alphaproteobacteria bacterium]
MTARRYVVGIDVGGTFTDILAHERHSGRLLSEKVPSIPGEQWRGVLDALTALGIDGADIDAFVHGTTIATNALLERKGAKTGLVTTQGFRDVLEIGKTRRLIGGLFDIGWQRPAPIVSRDLRLEVAERTAADGTILEPVDEAGLQALAEHFRAAGVQSVAVCLLNSYVNDANEQAVGALLRELLDGVPVSESAVLVPEQGEFERTSTCVLNAYLTPVMIAYLDTLSDSLTSRGLAAPVNIMGSNGGAMSLETAAGRVAGTFLSGPVGGVTGARRIAEMAGVSDCITFDMGGTSTDVALIRNLQPRLSHDNQIDAFPLQMPQLDIHTIGAGGGSIVWVQEDGTLAIGPQSAGAVPGPACYGRGGREATISDANLLLGRLPTARALSGGLMLDAALAADAFRALADRLETEDLTGLADAALRVAVAKMAGAVREVSVHRGFDPRDFALIGFGGAGPMHVFLVADELAIPRVVIPRFPGHLSALGQMLADVRLDSVAALGGRLGDLAVSTVRERIDPMVDRARAALIQDGISDDRHQHAISMDMRYVGQSFTLAIPWDASDADWAPLRRAFDARHRETFGYDDPQNDAEIVNIRLVSTGVVDKPNLRFETESAEDALLETRRVWFDGWRDCAVYTRPAMAVGFEFDGPAIVEEPGGTTVVPPGWSVSLHASGVLHCRNDNML